MTRGERRELIFLAPVGAYNHDNVCEKFNTYFSSRSLKSNWSGAIYK
jgi:hypothetical protein